MNRRGFIRGSLGLAFLGNVDSAEFDVATSPRKGFAIHQGYADQSSTLITVVRELKQSLVYKAFSPAGSELTLHVFTKTRTDSDWVVDLVSIEGLIVGEDHRLRVESEDGKLFDERIFRALNLDDPGARICVLSCTRDSSRRRQERMWASLESARPDVIFCIGDAVYVEDSVADIVIPSESPPEKIWRRFVETRNNLDFFRFKRLIPMMATWDDHDFGFNGGNELYRHKVASKLCFETFFPRPPESNRFIHGPGIAFMWDAFETRFLFLDGRYFRRETEKGAVGTSWGTAQKDWIKKCLKESPFPVWVLNGTQFMGDWIFNDSVVRRHPEDLKWLFACIRQIDKPVTLFSGDVHYSEIVQLPQDDVDGVMYEVTSSAMHTTGGVPFLNSGANRVAMTNENNYLIIKSLNNSKQNVTLEVVSYGDKLRELFTARLELSKTKPADSNA